MQNRAVAVLGVVGIALSVVALLGPWWVVDANGGYFAAPMTGTTEYRPFGVNDALRIGGRFNSTFFNATDYRFAPNIGRVFAVGATLAVLGTLSGVGMVLMASIPRLAERRKRLGASFGILAFGLTLAGLLVVTFLLPEAATQDRGVTAYPFVGFWGATHYPGAMAGFADVTYGAAWGWFAALVAALLFLVAAILLFRARPTPTPRVSPATPQPPQ